VVVVVRGRVDRREDTPRIMALDLSLPDLSQERRGPLIVSLPFARCTPPIIDRMKEVLRSHPGATEVHLRLDTPTSSTVMKIDDGLRVSVSPSLSADLKALLGPACLV
jgi:DNA polymerase-3 subunit alpha